MAGNDVFQGDSAHKLLFESVKKGTVDEVTVQLNKFSNERENLLNLRWENYGTLLHCACSRADGSETEIVNLILEKTLSPGMDKNNLTFINLENAEGNSAIQVALENGNENIVRLLLTNGASLSRNGDETQAMLIIMEEMPRLHEEMSELYKELEEEKRSILFDIIKNGEIMHAAVQIGSNIEGSGTLMQWRHQGRTILHCACERGENATALVRHILEMADYGFRMGNEEIRAFIDLPYTPTTGPVETVGSENTTSKAVLLPHSEPKYALNIAIEKGNAELAKLLIRNGADVNLPKNSKNEAIRRIYDNLPEILTDIFDAHLKWKPAAENSSVKMRTVTWDFTPVTGCLAHDLVAVENTDDKFKHLRSQTKLLTPALHRNEAERAEILLHPLVQIFLYYKYRKCWLFILISMIYHVLWSAASIFFITYICFPEAFGLGNATLINSTPSTTQANPESDPKSEVEEIAPTDWDVFIIPPFCAFWFFTLLKEITEIKFSPSCCYYLSQLENLGQWLLLISLIFVFFCQSLRNYFAVLGLFLAGILTLGQLNKIPWFGVYMEILCKVTCNILKFFFFFCPLIITYAGLMNLLFPNSDSFFTFWVAAKVVTMMTGEVGYDELFHPDEVKKVPPLPHPHVAKLVIMFFDFTVIIVLQNLLISLTISDIPALKEEAERDHCSMKLEQIYLIEKFLLRLRDKLCCCSRSSCRSCCCWSRRCKDLLLNLMVEPKSKPNQRFHDLPEEVQKVLKAAFKDTDRFRDDELATGCGINKPGWCASCCKKYFNCFSINKLRKCIPCCCNNN